MKKLKWKHPKLKHPLLCEVVLLLLMLSPLVLVVAVAACEFLPNVLHLLLLLGTLAVSMVLLFRNMSLIWGTGIMLDLLRCRQTARKQYDLPVEFSEEKLVQQVCRFGQHCEPLPLRPQPAELRYRFQSSWVNYAQGYEKIIAIYRVDVLDKAAYQDILNSARANFGTLEGRKKPRFLDKYQKKSPLHRVLVVLICAGQVDEVWTDVFEQIQKQAGDGIETAILPCVLDLSKRTCIFDGERLPDVFAYPVKNRGIRLIRRMVFGGRLPLKDNEYYLNPIPDCDPEQSVWNFLRDARKELGLADTNIKKQFASMKDREVYEDEDGYIYVRWGECGVLQMVEKNTENIVEVDEVSMWAWPKTRQMKKADIQAVKQCISAYYFGQGCTVKFEEPEKSK